MMVIVILFFIALFLFSHTYTLKTISQEYLKKNLKFYFWGGGVTRSWYEIPLHTPIFIHRLSLFY